MIVANSASYGEAHECSAIGFGPLPGHIDAQLFRNGSALIAAHAQPHIPARDKRIESFRRHQIACNLFHGKLIEWLVAVEGSDHIIAVRPDVAIVVEMQPIGIGIAGVVQPVARPLLAVTWPCQQPVHQVFIGLWRRIILKRLHLRGSRQQPRQVERDSPDQRLLVRLGRGMQPLFLQLRQHKHIDGILRPAIRLSRSRQRRPHRLFKSPVRPIDRTFLDPFPQDGNVRRVHRLRLALRVLRHQVVRVL